MGFLKKVEGIISCLENNSVITQDFTIFCTDYVLGLRNPLANLELILNSRISNYVMSKKPASKSIVQNCVVGKVELLGF